ncbi:ParB N-terminal domain-containing protein [Micromonospora sp. Llam7]|uniref:ParB/RepB/Spo0J family partition protein n=1 Tax=Micromonospora tarapacensis TaxID=2835305 RepID=UPI001C833560|nr:ParB N-terminal domain-containing protein [Micromonospora tarapacensis]MBX7266543.1 ParB N-terminal domain-containing protein [Micromonospora tarapacensis]
MGEVDGSDGSGMVPTLTRELRVLAVPGRPRQSPRPVHVPLDRLAPADSPRLDGSDSAYVRLLAEIDGRLPPILVHRTHMRVIDGMHRLHAAALRGQRTIDVHFFDGTEEQAFVESVRANAGHGLPLSLADRTAAARRIISAFGSWSDRTIAEVTGLAPVTVGTIRRSLTTVEQPPFRIGRDGRARPVDSNHGRRIAAEIIRRDPQTSLRETARRAGISPATVRDVRARLDRGENPTLEVRRSAAVDGQVTRTIRRVGANIDDLLRGLQQDPSLRFTDSGRQFLRWLNLRVVNAPEWHQVPAALPPHCTYSVARLARQCSEGWLAFAELLEQEAKDTA